MRKRKIARRHFLTQSAAGVATVGLLGALDNVSAQGSAGSSPRKAVQLGMIPKELPDVEKFQLARRCGFEGIEAYPLDDIETARLQGRLAAEAGTPIHSVCYGGWNAPFSHPDPAIIDQGLNAMENALRCAKAMGATAVLLVPAVVNESVRYSEAYERSQRHIRKLLPLAEELDVIIAVENVWNNFLLSPIEFARYVDEFQSPWLRAYFDVGNVVAFGWPQDWIRTLGERIVKVHLKDFKREGRQWTPLGEGDVNWPEVRKALLEELGYTGYVTPELPGGDETYLRDVSERIDRLLLGHA